jgi:transposase
MSIFRILSISVQHFWQGWYQFRVLCEAKCDKFGRDFRVISRWEPTSQVCSECDLRWGKLDLSVREVVCINCGTHDDRDGNAAKNIAILAGVVNFLPHPNPPRTRGPGVRDSQMI